MPDNATSQFCSGEAVVAYRIIYYYNILYCYIRIPAVAKASSGQFGHRVVCTWVTKMVLTFVPHSQSQTLGKMIIKHPVPVTAHKRHRDLASLLTPLQALVLAETPIVRSTTFSQGISMASFSESLPSRDSNGLGISLSIGSSWKRPGCKVV